MCGHISIEFLHFLKLFFFLFLFMFPCYTYHFLNTNIVFLASSKHKLIELEQQVTNLTEKLMENDQEKEQLKLELRSANISLQDVQQRLHTMQVINIKCVFKQIDPYSILMICPTPKSNFSNCLQTN